MSFFTTSITNISRLVFLSRFPCPLLLKPLVFEFVLGLELSCMWKLCNHQTTWCIISFPSLHSIFLEHQQYMECSHCKFFARKRQGCDYVIPWWRKTFENNSNLHFVWKSVPNICKFFFNEFQLVHMISNNITLIHLDIVKFVQQQLYLSVGTTPIFGFQSIHHIFCRWSFFE